MIAAFIPARSGSKRIRDKNIQSFRGIPLIGHSVKHAQAADSINEIFVDTDSEEYAEIAQSFGAEVPYIRPRRLATDTTPDFEVFKFFVEWYHKNRSNPLELIVHLRPTYPIRSVNEIEDAIDLMRRNPEWDSLRSVCLSKDTPYKMWHRDSAGRLVPVIDYEDLKDPWSQPYETLPKIYLQNASIDIIRPATITAKGSMSGEIVGSIQQDHNYDIDEWEDLDRIFTKVGNDVLPCESEVVVDIDGVIATLTADNDYSKARPITKNIQGLNLLKKLGNKIILSTARGSKTGFDWKGVTENQLKDWGVSYDELHFGKLPGDLFIDDRMKSPSFLAQLVNKTSQ